jgi:hypothetical protein
MEFIINTNTIWDSPPKARHQIAYSLAKKYKVTFISGNKMGMPGFEIKSISENLDVIIPSFPVSRKYRYRTPGLNELYQNWLYPKLKRSLNGEDIYVICSDFGGYKISDYFEKIIYFASDDYINNVKVPYFMKVYTSFTQKRLIRSAFFTVATAITLVNDFAKINGRSFELPLGAPDFTENKKYKRIIKPHDTIKVVLLGYIDKVKTPVGLLNKILENQKTELYLVGPIKDDILQHISWKNRVFPMGIQTGDNLIKILTSMDVGIAPYYMEDPNTGRTPNKMWQYLSVGLPAVITNLPNTKHWVFPDNIIYKANTDNEFTEMIRIAYETDTMPLIASRIKIARDNSWDTRADLLIGYIKGI